MTKPRTTVPTPDHPTEATSALAALVGPSAMPVAIDVDLLRPHPANPRRDLGDLTELGDSIRAHGVRQNLLVVPDPDEAGAYRIVIGHRRASAARSVGVLQLVAVVDEDLTPAEQLELMLLENIQRSDLSAVEEADAYQGLLDLGMDEATIAQNTGRSRATVRSRLKLVALPEQARTAVHTHAATLTDVAALDEFTDPEVHARLADALGTDDFARAVATERSRQALAQKFKPWLEALAAGNATELARNEWDTPDGLTRAFTISAYADLTTDAFVDRLLELERMGAGWAWRWQYQDIVIYRPFTLEETEEAARRDEESAAAKAQRAAESERYAAERAEQDAAEAARRELADVTATTRGEFLEGLIRGRKLNAAETRSVVTFAGFELLLSAWVDDHETVWGSAEGAIRWLGVDTDAVAARAQDEDLDADDAVDHEVRAALAAMDPANRLLAGLAAANEPIAYWQLTGPDRQVRAWYALLEDLGYVLSSDERALLAPPDTEQVAA